MVWRDKPADAKRATGPTRKAALKAALRTRVADGMPIGILGYSGREPVAWCSIAPRPTYRPLGGPAEPADAPEAVWSLVCFYVKREFRGRGLTDALIRAAVSHARCRGANIVEAYPVEPDSPSYRFMGFLGAFERAGFERVGRAGTRRHVMRLNLG